MNTIMSTTMMMTMTMMFLLDPQENLQLQSHRNSIDNQFHRENPLKLSMIMILDLLPKR